MDELLDALLSKLASAGWPAVAFCIVVFALLVTLRQWRKADKDQAERKKRRRDYEAANRARIDALNRGDAYTAHQMKLFMDQLSKMGLAIALALLFCGCRTRAVVTTLWLSEYARTIAPGDTVPSLPEGESCWWLMSAPRGLEAMMPQPTPMFVPVSMPEAEDK